MLTGVLEAPSQRIEITALQEKFLLTCQCYSITQILHLIFLSVKFVLYLTHERKKSDGERFT